MLQAPFRNGRASRKAAATSCASLCSNSETSGVLLRHVSIAGWRIGKLTVFPPSINFGLFLVGGHNSKSHYLSS